MAVAVAIAATTSIPPAVAVPVAFTVVLSVALPIAFIVSVSVTAARLWWYLSTLRGRLLPYKL